jgi:hypothetical protein
VVAEIGSGTASALHSGAAVYSSGPGNGSSRGFGVTNSWTVGDFFQFAVTTTGYQGISISYDQAGTSRGPSTFYLAYSTDGSTFTKFGSDYQVQLGSWNTTTVNTTTSYTFDLGSVTAINDSPTVYFRVVDDSTLAINGGIVGGYQDDRIDNFLISAQQVPEPPTMALTTLGVCGIFLWSARRSKLA